VGEGQALQVPVMSTDPDEGDYVTLAVSNQLLPGSSLTMTTSGTGTFDWVPWYDAAGTYDDVLLIARDRDGFRDTDAFRITVTNVFVPPQATGVSINDGMQFTNTAAVVLLLSASNAAWMAIANDESGLTNWVPYTLTSTWTLAGVEGTNDVYVRYRTPWGDESTNVHDAIVLDLTPPACAGVFPPDGWITNGLPELVWQGSDAPGGAGLAGFELETNSFGTLLATNHFTFEVESQGSNTWRVRATDGAGNTGPWTVSRWFFFDSAPPMKTHVKFVDGRGNGWTAQTNVLLSLKAFDASPIQVRLGTSADLGGAAWQPYATTVNWQLVEGEGMNHIYAEFRDSAMQAAPVVSDTIGLDMTAPSLGVLWPTQTWTWTNAALALNWSANDTVGGLSGTWVVVNGLAAFRPGVTYTPAWLAEQTNSWRMQAVDLAGNTSAWTSVSYVGFDTNAPILAQDLILAPQSDATWLQGSWEEVRWQSTGITDWILADTPVALNLLLWPDLAFTNLSISVSNSGSALVQAPLFDTDQFCLVSLRVNDRCGNSAQALSEAFDLLVPEPGGLLLLAGIAAWRARARRHATSTR
jgi:hypothetical protein